MKKSTLQHLQTAHRICIMNNKEKSLIKLLEKKIQEEKKNDNNIRKFGR